MVAADLLQNGLELETVSLTQLDQTAMEFFNPSNAFDAEGLTRLTEQIERRKKMRNDIEQDTMIQIRNKNLETERQALDIDRELEYARLEQERELEMHARRAARRGGARARAEGAGGRARADLVARGDRPGAHRVRARGRGGADRRASARSRRSRSSAGRRSSWPSSSARSRWPQQSKAQSEAQAAADKARAHAVTEEERVFTARETEMAERRKRIELIDASQEAEREALRLKVAAQAENAASADRGAAVRAEAEAEADSEKIRALAARIRHEVEAEGQRLMNEAQNMLTPEARTSAMRLQAHRQARGDHPRVGAADGAHRGHQDPAGRRARRRRRRSTAGCDGSGGGFADSVVNSALRFRAQAPLVDQLLREIGVEGGDVGKLARGLLERQGGAAPALADVPASGTGRE